jgi:hypothetical protein
VPWEHCVRYYSEDDIRGCGVANFIVNGRSYHSVSVNPNNNDEFVVVENNSLIKFNLETKEKTVLLDSQITVNTPDWGREGWIVFSAGWKIWRIKENGTQLSQLTFTPRDLSPKFDPAGFRLVYSEGRI